jgi:hypothetical protein
LNSHASGLQFVWNYFCLSGGGGGGMLLITPFWVFGNANRQQDKSQFTIFEKML